MVFALQNYIQLLIFADKGTEVFNIKYFPFIGIRTSYEKQGTRYYLVPFFLPQLLIKFALFGYAKSA